MSWSVSFLGTPDKAVTALEAYATTQSGQSKVEYDAALPNLVELAKQNFEDAPALTPVISLTASGHGHAADGEQKSRHFTLKIERLDATLL